MFETCADAELMFSERHWSTSYFSWLLVLYDGTFLSLAVGLADAIYTMYYVKIFFPASAGSVS